MKKIISLILVLVMLCAVAMSASAEEFTITTSTSENATGEGQDYTWNINVTAGLQAEEVTEADVAANYYVVVSWEVESDLVYSIGKEAYSWNVYSDVATKTDATAGNAAGAGYEVDYSQGTWTGSATVKVTVTNWSNRAVTANVAFDPAEKNDQGVVADITVSGTEIDKPTLNIAAASDYVEKVADGEITEKAASDVATVTLDSNTITAGGIDKADAVIGTVTITLVGLETATESTPPTAEVTP